ncbi:helix-turn-helix domain-containing protein [Planosporangium thailandense]|uniref:Helix-turn-helix domain-containing protein n=1 Tax=Planosporangium thailandense TaxID=765197 RepID=A0ABX0XWS8_9ACTN|nr:helix-turn-helix transcriptional regulator [Planosporangium thailandense]NJC69747.1 helix-turn-helix domain-containing protein [Planosporangium thailandense]
MPISGSTLVRRQLGRRLRRLREAAGKSERDVETAKLLSRTKLWRIESGKTAIKVADVRALCWLYGADAPTTDALAGLAVGTTEQGWWEDYREAVPDWFGLYIGLEAAASEIRIYDPELVHGLLQTPAYVRALWEAGAGDRSEQAVQGQINLRMQRQRSIRDRVPPLRVAVVLGAGVLARSVGGAQVMAEQVDRLCELSKLDHIDIRVLTWDAGAHAAMHTGAFTILDFDDPDDPAVVYLETHTGARYLERPEELDQYRRIFDLICVKAVPIEEYVP